MLLLNEIKPFERIFRNVWAVVLLCLVFSPVVALRAQESLNEDSLSLPYPNETENSAPMTGSYQPISADSLASLDKSKRKPLRDQLSFSLEGNVSYLIPMDEQCRAIMHNYGTSYYGLAVQHRAKPEDADKYDRAYGLPQFEMGLLWADFSHIRLYRDTPRLPYNSALGGALALYGSMRRDLMRTGRLSVGYILGNGVGLAFRPYNRTDNADNELIGSRWNVFIDLGFYGGYRFAPHWEASIGINYRHFSNSALDRPNKGSNTIGATARLTYILDSTPPPPLRDVPRPEKEKVKTYTEVTAAFAAKSLLDDWMVNYYEREPSDPKYRSSHYNVYGAFHCSVAQMVRYHTLYASGIGLDYTYAPYASRLAQLDDERGRTGYHHSRHSLGLGLRHEVFFHRLSLSMGLGVYLFRQMGYTAKEDETPYYEYIGIRYNIPVRGDRLFVGYSVKAHRTKADCFMLYAGVRIGK